MTTGRLHLPKPHARSACRSTACRRRDAEARLATYGPNIIQRQRPLTRLGLLWRQLKSPLLLLLIFAAAASLAGGEWVDAASVIAIVVASVGIGFVREYHAHTALQALAARIHTHVKSRAGRSTDPRPG